VGTDNLEDLGVDGIIILNGIFKELNREEWTGWLRIGTGGGAFVGLLYIQIKLRRLFRK
jgi:hypothetical protein